MQMSVEKTLSWSFGHWRRLRRRLTRLFLFFLLLLLLLFILLFIPSICITKKSKALCIWNIWFCIWNIWPWNWLDICCMAGGKLLGWLGSMAPGN